MGGSPPSFGGSANSTLQAYLKYLPQLMQVTSAAQPGVDLTQARSSAATTPITSQTGLSNLQDFGAKYDAAGNKITDATTQAGSRTIADEIGGAGGDAASAADALNRRLNPEWYATRTATGNQANNLINSINLNGLSGGEQAAVERSLNTSNTATGNLGVDNATNAVSNAMNFGNALQQKRDALGTALDKATSFMGSAQNTSFNPVGVATSQPTATTNFGTSQFAGVSGAGTQAASAGGNLLNTLGSLSNTNQQLQAASSQVNSPMGIAGDIGKSYS